MTKQNDIIGVRDTIGEVMRMNNDIQIKEVNGADIVQYKPQGVCSKLMQLRIKDNIIQDVEFVGGCSGNLGGISVLIKGMNINDVASKLTGIPCGNRPTSCPDQLSKAIEAYIETKNAAKTEQTV